MLLYRIAADLVVTVHFGYIAFVVVGLAAILIGGPRGWRWVRGPRFRLLHLLAIAIVAGQAVLGIVCPLTTLEKALRVRGGQESYPGAFIGHWAHRLTFYQAPPWVFTTVYVLFGLAVVATMVLIPPRWRADRTSP